jgi:hypothetical protein
LTALPHGVSLLSAPTNCKESAWSS